MHPKALYLHLQSTPNNGRNPERMGLQAVINALELPVGLTTSPEFEARADMDASNTNGATALSRAFARGHSQVRVAKNQGHLMWTQNNRMPQTRTPSQKPSFINTPPAGRLLM